MLDPDVGGVVVANAVSTAAECGTGLCPDDPTRYEALDAWLDEYTTGELWEMNLLGGMPGPDIVPPPREQGAAS